MRKTLILGLPVVVVTVAALAWMGLHTSDPIANARQRIARQDMRGAEFYLRQELRRQPDNAEAAFLLGQVDLATGNPQAAELELRRARERGYRPAAIVYPMGQAYLQQQHYDALLRDFNPDQAPADERGDILTLRAAAQLSLGDAVKAASTAASAEAARARFTRNTVDSRPYRPRTRGPGRRFTPDRQHPRSRASTIRCKAASMRNRHAPQRPRYRLKGRAKDLGC